MRHQVIDDLVDFFVPSRSYADQWDGEGLKQAMAEKAGVDVPTDEWVQEEGVDAGIVRERLYAASGEMMSEKTEAFGPETMRNIEKHVLLQTIDAKWREHLLTLEHLRSVVGFRGYAQRDPLNEYKTESFQLFESLLNGLREDVTQKLALVRPQTAEEQAEMMRQLVAQQQAMRSAAQPGVAQEAETPPADPSAARPGFDEADASTWGNPGRNDACPCGSGNKFKHCHGKIT